MANTYIDPEEAAKYINSAEESLAGSTKTLDNFAKNISDLSSVMVSRTMGPLYEQAFNMTEQIKILIEYIAPVTETHEYLVQQANVNASGTGAFGKFVPGSFTTYGGYQITSDDKKVGIRDAGKVSDLLGEQVKLTTQIQAYFTSAIQNYKRLYNCSAGFEQIQNNAHYLADKLRGFSETLSKNLESYTNAVKEYLQGTLDLSTSNNNLTEQEIQTLSKRIDTIKEKIVSLPSAASQF